MRAPIYQVDAFTTRRFAGNPAAIIPLPSFLPDATLQAVAQENNLAETAYLVRSNGNYDLRWFTPGTEVPLCGHATLASAAVVMERLEPTRNQVVFHSASGPLTVKKNGAGYVMDFPTRPSSPVSAPAGLAEALGATPLEVTENDFNFLALIESEKVLRALAPDMAALIRLGKGGVIVTAKSDDPQYDFVSRYFAPSKASRKTRSPARRTACSRRGGRSGSAKPTSRLSRRRPAAAKFCAVSAATAPSSKANVFSIWKAKWKSKKQPAACSRQPVSGGCVLIRGDTWFRPGCRAAARRAC